MFFFFFFNCGNCFNYNWSSETNKLCSLLLCMSYHVCYQWAICQGADFSLEVVEADEITCGSLSGFSALTPSCFPLNLSPVSPALPSPSWTSWAPARARRCILPTGKSRQVARSARSRSRRVCSGRGQRTSRAIGCSPPSSCSDSRAWFPLYAPPPRGTARVLRCSGRSFAFSFFSFKSHLGLEKRKTGSSREFSP